MQKKNEMQKYLEVGENSNFYLNILIEKKLNKALIRIVLAV